MVSGMTRYKLIPPFPHGGEAWWLIADTELHGRSFNIRQFRNLGFTYIGSRQ